MPLDDEVAALVRAGRTDAAATALIEELGPEILGYLRAVVRDEGAAADAFSLFAEGAWRGLSSFRGEASLRAWCYRIAWRCVLSRLRDPYQRRREPIGTTMASCLAGRIYASSAVRREEQATALERLRAVLGEEEQTLLTLRLDRRLSWAEVAQVMAEDGASPPEEPALRKRFERLKEKLARAAREQGLVL
jgi:RNA polymerase sigma-70 factor (ECF subfamily)